MEADTVAPQLYAGRGGARPGRVCPECAEVDKAGAFARYDRTETGAYPGRGFDRIPSKPEWQTRPVRTGRVLLLRLSEAPASCFRGSRDCRYSARQTEHACALRDMRGAHAQASFCGTTDGNFRDPYNSGPEADGHIIGGECPCLFVTLQKDEMP